MKKTQKQQRALKAAWAELATVQHELEVTKMRLHGAQDELLQYRDARVTDLFAAGHLELSVRLNRKMARSIHERDLMLGSCVRMLRAQIEEALR